MTGPFAMLRSIFGSPPLSLETVAKERKEYREAIHDNQNIVQRSIGAARTSTAVSNRAVEAANEVVRLLRGKDDKSPECGDNDQNQKT